MLRLILLTLMISMGYFGNMIAQQTVGLFKNDSTSFNGYTLFAPSSFHSTYLIDNCGEVVNTWTSEYNPGISAYLLENGNLLRTAQIANDFNGGGSGGRIELFNWEGDLIWAYNYATDNYNQHHDVAFLANGNILVLAWELMTEAEAKLNGRVQVADNGLWSEQIVELKPIGTDSAEVVWEWHLKDHLIQDRDATKLNYGQVSEHPERMDFNFPSIANVSQGIAIDWMHFNSIDYHSGLDQIILSARNSHEIYIIDHSTTTEEAAESTGGLAGKGGDFLYRWGNPQAYDRGGSTEQQLFAQHDAHWIPSGRIDEGKIMIFNNGLNRPDGNYSSVDIIEPPVDASGNYFLAPQQNYEPATSFWSYVAENPGDFYARRMSGAQQLENGNVLICDGPKGHFFEVESERRIVWDYINPIRQGGPVVQGSDIFANDVFRTYRYGLDYPAFDGKDLVPMGAVELDPLDSDCQLYQDNVSSTQNHLLLKGIKMGANPVHHYLELINETGTTIQIEITDLAGRVVLNEQHQGQAWSYHIQNWTNGLYILKISSLSTRQIFTQKIVKI